MIKDKITPELESKFQTAINKTRENGEEHGFYICEDKKKLFPSELRFGKDSRINLGDPVVACHGKKVQGNFHTHSYLTLFKQKSKFMRQGMSDEDVKNFIKQKHSELIKETGVKGITLDSPSPRDLLISILYSCIRKPEGIICVGNDMGNNNEQLKLSKVECWAPKEIQKVNCDRAYHTLYSDGKEKDMIAYEPWMIPLFDKEVINIPKKRK
jgi:hypothetical protein